MSEPTTELDTRFSDPDTSPTSWDDARRTLEAAELFWITTVRADGRPHVSPLVAVWLDGALHFSTGAAEQKAVNLRTNPHVILTTGCNHWDRGLDVVVEGDAVQVTDHATLQRLADVWRTKWDGRWQFQAGAGAFQHEAGEALVFSVAPAKVLASARALSPTPATGSDRPIDRPSEVPDGTSRSIGKRAGLGAVHPHVLRAAFIMAALDAGVPTQWAIRIRRMRTEPLPERAPGLCCLASTKRRAGAPGGSGVHVFVVAAQPEVGGALLVASHRRPVQQAVVGHGGLKAARRGHVGPVDGAVRERVCAQPGPLGDVPKHIRTGRLRHLGHGRGDLAVEERLQLLLGVLEAKVAVEVAADGGDPIEAPSHPRPVGEQPLQGRARGADQRHVAGLEVDRVGIEGVRDRGTDGAAGLVGRAEHEVVDEQLRTPVEQVGERLRPRLGLEPVVLLDGHPGKLPPLLRELVVASSELLLLREQLLPGCVEFLLRADPVLGHCVPSCVARSWAVGDSYG